MMPEEKRDITELVTTLKQLNPTGLMLVQNSADTLLTYQRMREKSNKEKGELVQQ